MTYERWFPLIIWRNIWRLLTKYGAQEHQGKTKTKFEPGDLHIIFKVTEVIQVMAYERWFLLNILRNILRILPKFDTQKHQDKMKPKFEHCDLDLIFQVTEVI